VCLFVFVCIAQAEDGCTLNCRHRLPPPEEAPDRRLGGGHVTDPLHAPSTAPLPVSRRSPKSTKKKDGMGAATSRSLFCSRETNAAQEAAAEAMAAQLIAQEVRGDLGRRWPERGGGGGCNRNACCGTMCFEAMRMLWAL
jgi:hypothetical protein